MTALTLVTLLLKVEIFLLLLCLFAILFFAFWGRYKDHKHHQAQEHFRESFMPVLLHKKELDVKAILSHPFEWQDLLLAIESFNRRFSDESWIKIKDAILSDEMMTKVRQLTDSSKWINRNIGIRFIRLKTSHKDEEIILKLLDDPHALVRIPAAECAVHLNTEKTIRKVLEKMATESEFGRFPYRDCLVKSKTTVFDKVEKIFKTDPHKGIKDAALDVLSSHVTEDLFPYLADYLNSENVEDKVLGLKALSNFSNHHSIENLIKSLKDEHWQVRVQAAKGLGQLMENSSLPQLVQTLRDPVWLVRLEAARSIRKLGPQGQGILAGQDPDINQDAYQAAQYVLALPT